MNRSKAQEDLDDFESVMKRVIAIRSDAMRPESMASSEISAESWSD